jgi:Zn-dependent membrane protease YugP
VFSITKKEGVKNAYQSYATKNSSNSGDEVEVATNLLNIVGSFQIIFAPTPTTLMGPFEPSTFYVEIPLNPPTPIDN